MLHAAYRFYLAAPLPVPSTIITSPNKLLGCAQRCPSLLLSSQQTPPAPSTIMRLPNNLLGRLGYFLADKKKPAHGGLGMAHPCAVVGLLQHCF